VAKATQAAVESRLILKRVALMSLSALTADVAAT
jgi:hypothetical protein